MRRKLNKMLIPYDAAINAGWTRKKMLKYLKLTDFDITNEELWQLVVDYKSEKLIEIFYKK